MSKGHTSEEMAVQLKCSIPTIKTYRARIMSKSGARNSAEMISWYLKGYGK
ncbi:MAG: helix-turn-helix transcriptional regulator [Bdellovibrionales bacterium]|nr:helix-turn-helix transcriptional regulator [Bdellovibrionales bacterium]